MVHRCNQYRNNRLEQDRRAITGRYQPMRGFGGFPSAARICTAYDGVGGYFRDRTRLHEVVPLGIRQEQCGRVLDHTEGVTPPTGGGVRLRLDPPGSHLVDRPVEQPALPRAAEELLEVVGRECLAQARDVRRVQHREIVAHVVLR